MQKKLLNLSLILTSLIGYLEWGKDQSVLLFQAEAEMFSRALDDPAAVIHPFTILPVLGQLTLLATLFQKVAGKTMTYLGIAGIGILFAFMFVIGAISQNVKILSSTIPFLVLAGVAIREHRRAKNKSSDSQITKSLG